MDSSVFSSPILPALPELEVGEEIKAAAVSFVDAMQAQGFKAIASDFDGTLTKVHTWNYHISSHNPFTQICSQEAVKRYFSNPENDVFSDFKLLYTIIKEARQRGIPFYICTRGFPENVVNFFKIAFSNSRIAEDFVDQIFGVKDSDGFKIFSGTTEASKVNGWSKGNLLEEKLASVGRVFYMDDNDTDIKSLESKPRFTTHKFDGELGLTVEKCQAIVSSLSTSPSPAAAAGAGAGVGVGAGAGAGTGAGVGAGAGVGVRVLVRGQKIIEKGCSSVLGKKKVFYIFGGKEAFDSVFCLNGSLDTYNSAEGVEGSYLHTKKQIIDKGYGGVFEFDDEKKLFYCLASSHFMKLNEELMGILRVAFKRLKLDQPGYGYYEGKYFDEGYEDDKIIKASDVINRDFEVSANSFFAGYSNPRVSTQANIRTLFDKSFCIGEVHGHASPKRFLIENMQKLKESGYKTIFLEHYLYDSVMQDLLDQYHQSRDLEIPKALEEYSKALAEGNYLMSKDYNFLEVIKAAKQQGIRVVAIDTVSSYKMGMTAFGSQGAERMKGMNYAAKSIIEQESDGGKWVALIGSAHSIKHCGIVGLPQLLGVTSVVVSDVAKKGYEVSYGDIVRDGDRFNEILIKASLDQSLALDVLTTTSSASVSPPSPILPVDSLADEGISKAIRLLREYQDLIILKGIFVERAENDEARNFDDWYANYIQSLVRDDGAAVYSGGTTRTGETVQGVSFRKFKEELAKILSQDGRKDGFCIDSQLFGSALCSLFSDNDDSLMKDILSRIPRLQVFLKDVLDGEEFRSKTKAAWDEYKKELAERGRPIAAVGLAASRLPSTIPQVVVTPVLPPAPPAPTSTAAASTTARALGVRLATVASAPRPPVLPTARPVGQPRASDASEAAAPAAQARLVTGAAGSASTREEGARRPLTVSLSLASLMPSAQVTSAPGMASTSLPRPVVPPTIPAAAASSLATPPVPMTASDASVVSGVSRPPVSASADPSSAVLGVAAPALPPRQPASQPTVLPTMPAAAASSVVTSPVSPRVLGASAVDVPRKPVSASAAPSSAAPSSAALVTTSSSLLPRSLPPRTMPSVLPVSGVASATLSGKPSHNSAASGKATGSAVPEARRPAARRPVAPRPQIPESPTPPAFAAQEIVRGFKFVDEPSTPSTTTGQPLACKLVEYQIDNSPFHNQGLVRANYTGGSSDPSQVAQEMITEERSMIVKALRHFESALQLTQNPVDNAIKALLIGITHYVAQIAGGILSRDRNGNLMPCAKGEIVCDANGKFIGYKKGKDIKDPSGQTLQPQDGFSYHKNGLEYAQNFWTKFLDQGGYGNEPEGFLEKAKSLNLAKSSIFAAISRLAQSQADIDDNRLFRSGKKVEIGKRFTYFDANNVAAICQEIREGQFGDDLQCTHFFNKNSLLN